jgi:hypothetical protein
MKSLQALLSYYAELVKSAEETSRILNEISRQVIGELGGEMTCSYDEQFDGYKFQLKIADMIPGKYTYLNIAVTMEELRSAVDPVGLVANSFIKKYGEWRTEQRIKT